MAPLRMVNDPPARFEYAYEAEIVCLTGPPDPDIDNDNDIDTVPPRKRGPIVAPQKDRTLTVGEFTLATRCAGETPSPSPSPTPVPTSTPGTRSVVRSTAATTATTAAAPAATSRSFYVIQIDIADRFNPTVVSGPAAVAYDALNFAAAAAPLQLTAGHRYIFALAYQDTPVTPSPSPTPTATPSPVPTDSPTPGPSPTISPCPGAVSLINQGTYCFWTVPHPPVDFSLSNPDIMYSSSTGAVLGRFNVRDHSARELPINGTPYSLTGGHEANVNGTYVGISSPTNNLGFNIDGSPAALDVFAPPPDVPASPHNIAGDACNGQVGGCSDVAIANGDIFFYNPSTQTIDFDFPLSNPAASASVISRTFNGGPFDILALTPDRHIVYAQMDDHGANFSEHLLPDVLPAGYRFTGAARNTSGFHFTASDYQYGGNPRGHGIHEVVDLNTYTSRTIPFDSSSTPPATCDAMGISTGQVDGTYFIPCVVEVREFFESNDKLFHDAPIEADGAVTYQIGADGRNNAFFTSYQHSSIIELQFGVFYPGVRQQSKLRAPMSRR